MEHDIAIMIQGKFASSFHPNKILLSTEFFFFFFFWVELCTELIITENFIH